MQEKDQHRTDPHLDTPSESNTEKHINFREVEEESSGNFFIDKTTSERQKQWREQIQEGKEEKRRSDSQSNNSTMPIDEDDMSRDL